MRYAPPSCADRPRNVRQNLAVSRFTRYASLTAASEGARSPRSVESSALSLAEDGSMKRILGHVVSLLVVGLAVSAALPACATNDQTIFIRNALAPAITRTNGICTYTN